MAPEHSRNRHYDQTVIGRIWHESKLWIHLMILVTSAAVAWQVLAGDVAAAARKNIEQDAKLEKLENIAQVQTITSARIEEKVDYIREDVQQIKREQVPAR